LAWQDNASNEAGYRVDRHEDVDEDAIQSLRHVGIGNRFAQDGQA